MAQRLSSFLIKKLPKQAEIRQLRAMLGDSSIHTVCEEAKCPNIGECFANQTCTFMILGDTCTRNCAFCGVTHGKALPPDPEEPQKIAEAVKKLGLNYVVITSVTRDDLPDGGASHFANVVRELLAVSCQLLVEILIPDFQGNKDSLQTVLDAKPYVLNHNIETVPRLYSKIRPQADYRRSLELLATAKRSGQAVYTKSGFMVGLGETKDEIREVLFDLREAGCDIVTVGQYLSPSKSHLQPERYVEPEEFAEYKALGLSIGFKQIEAGPFVRSSYHAGETAKCLK